MLTVDTLRAFGANVDEGLGRCMGREDFYLRLVKMVRTDTNIVRLREAVDAGDLKAGFEAAHALKGVLANLALTPIQQPVSEITEFLRADTAMDYQPLLKRIEDEWARFAALVDG